MHHRRLRNIWLILLGVVLSIPFSSIGPLRSLPVLAYTWDASVDSSHVPGIWYTQTSPSFDVTVTNTGTATWPAGGANPVHVAFYFSFQNRDTVNDCVGGVGTCRYGLPSDIPPGQSATVHVQKATPFDVGAYTLEINMVQEGVFWFDTQTPNLPVSVSVQAKVACGSYCSR